MKEKITKTNENGGENKGLTIQKKDNAQSIELNEEQELLENMSLYTENNTVNELVTLLNRVNEMIKIKQKNLPEESEESLNSEILELQLRLYYIDFLFREEKYRMLLDEKFNKDELIHVSITTNQLEKLLETLRIIKSLSSSQNFINMLDKKISTYALLSQSGNMMLEELIKERYPYDEFSKTELELAISMLNDVIVSQNQELMTLTGIEKTLKSNEIERNEQEVKIIKNVLRNKKEPRI